MKKKLLTIALALASTAAFSQIEAGTKILGGEFNYSSYSDKHEDGNGNSADGDEWSNFTIIPSFGYMFAENMGAGLRLGIDNDTWKSTNNGNGDIDENKDNLTIVGLFGRYYVPVAGDALYFHTDLILDFGFGSNTNTHTDGTTGVSTETKSDVNTTLIGIRPGWDYFIGDKWAVELNWGFLGYESRANEGANGAKTTTSGFNVNVDFTSVSLGARWYF